MGSWKWYLFVHREKCTRRERLYVCLAPNRIQSKESRQDIHMIYINIHLVSHQGYSNRRRNRLESSNNEVIKWSIGFVATAMAMARRKSDVTAITITVGWYASVETAFSSAYRAWITVTNRRVSRSCSTSWAYDIEEIKDHFWLPNSILIRLDRFYSHSLRNDYQN